MNDYFELVSEFIEYATGSGTFEIGDFVLIKDDAPAKAKKAYKQYIKLIEKTILSWEGLSIEHRRIVGVNAKAKGKEKEQCEIVMELIKAGYINQSID
nr:MAG TPA: hypothetical protein [Caudoviricetes sp.]